MADQLIAASAFEGLFVQGLKVSGAVVDKLRAVGFDPQRMETSYTVEVWRRALQVASMEYFPTLAPHDAEFQLGVRMVDGYLDTIIGRVIQAALPFLSPDMLCQRLPRFFSGGVVGMKRQPIVKRVADRHYLVTLYGEHGVPWFTAGSVDATLRKTRVVPTVKVAEVNDQDFSIDITWAAPSA